jgi:Dolichyl-phosphate-mannose-protein mannosyltransferase
MASATVARARGRAFSFALVRAVPVAAWLAGMVTLSAIVRFAVARRMTAPWIMVDELVYSELARGIASGAGYALRGEAVGLGYGAVYPLLISPAYLLGSLTDAYVAAQAINAVLLSLAAVPAYLLARRLVSPPLALLVAALSLAVPSLFYAGTVMTENAFYPVFLAAVLLLVRALERPTPLRVALLLAATGVAFLTRTQAVALVPAMVTAPLLLAVWRGRWRTVMEYRWLYGGLAATAALVLAAAALRGRSPASLLGAYRAAGEYDYRAADVARWLLYHLGELDLYVGIAPFAALLLLVLRARALPDTAQALVAGAVAVSGWLVLEVATFATIPSILRVEERNLFYLAPLFFAALAYWLEQGVPRPRVVAALAGAVAVALPAFVPYPRLINVSARSDTLALLPLWRLAELWSFALERVWVVVVVGGAVLVALLVLLPRRALIVLPLLLFVLYGLAAQPIDARLSAVSVGSLFQGIRADHRDWVDRAAGAGSDVAALWTGRTDPLTIFENELFNHSIGPVYYLQAPLPGGLPQRGLGIDPRDGVLRGQDGEAVPAPYLLTDYSLPFEGRVVGRDELRGMRVFRTGGQPRVSGLTEGVYGDLWSEPSFTYRGFRCDGGTLRARLGSDPAVFSRPQRVVAYVNGEPVARTRVRQDVEQTLLRVPLRARGDGVCLVRFQVLDTAVPGGGDARRLGIRVLGLER